MSILPAWLLLSEHSLMARPPILPVDERNRCRSARAATDRPGSSLAGHSPIVCVCTPPPRRRLAPLSIGVCAPPAPALARLLSPRAGTAPAPRPAGHLPNPAEITALSSLSGANAPPPCPLLSRRKLPSVASCFLAFSSFDPAICLCYKWLIRSKCDTDDPVVSTHPHL